VRFPKSETGGVITREDAGVTQRKNHGPDSWLGSWEGGVLAIHPETIRWLSPLRGTIVTVLVTVVGLRVGGPAIGVPLAVGALFTAVVDVDQIPGRRARTMLWAALWLAVVTFLGGIASVHLVTIMLVAIPVALACGFAGALGSRAAMAGVLCLVTFSAFTFDPLTPEGALQAAVMVALGGLIQTGVTVVATLLRNPSALRHVEAEPSVRDRLTRHRTLRDDFVRHAIRLTIAMEIAFVLDDALPSIHSVWIPITVAWVTTPDRHGTVNKVIARIIGTLAGVAFVLGTTWLAGTADVILVALLAISSFLALVMLRANYSVAVVGVTGFMLSLFALTGDNLDALGVDRVLDTVIAAGVVLLVSTLILRGAAPDAHGENASGVPANE
jgi:hypothetical protein